MKRERKRVLSVVLMITMIASLFTGSALGQGKSAGTLFKNTPVVLVSEDGQVKQTLEVASPAQAELADGRLIASGSNAIQSLAATDDGKIEVVLMDNITQLPANERIELQGSADTYSGSVSYKWNWFSAGLMTMDSNEEAQMASSSNAESLAGKTVKFDVTPNILDVTQKDGKIVAAVKAGEVTADTEARITMTIGGKVAGICDVEITYIEDSFDKTFITEKEKTLSIGTAVQLELTPYGEALLADPDLAAKVKVTSDDPSIAAIEKKPDSIEVKGLKLGETEITVEYPGEEGAAAAYYKDVCVVKVTLAEENREDFFEQKTMPTIVKGSVVQLPLRKEVWTAVRNEEADLTSGSTKIADISEKSGASACYIKGMGEGKTTFTVVWGDKWDECEVTVIEGKKKVLLDIPSEDEKTVTVNVNGVAEIGLTETALDLIDEELEKDEKDQCIEAVSLDENVAEAEYDGILDSNMVTITGVGAGETTVTFRIGEYVDTCQVIVERNFAEDLRNALDSVRDLTEEELQDPGKKTLVEQAITAIQKLTKDINKSNLKEALNQVADEEKQELAVQMTTIANMEELLTVMNPNIIKKAPDLAKAPAAISGFECIGAGLNVDPTATQPTHAQIIVNEAPVAVPGKNLSENAVAMDISLNIHENGETKSGEQPRSLMQVKMNVPEGLEGDLIIYHVHDNGKVTSFEPYYEDRKIVFYITSLSAFVIDEKDVETVSLLVEDAVGAYMNVYSEKNNVRTYVPVGEKVDVPVGTEITVRPSIVARFSPVSHTITSRGEDTVIEGKDTRDYTYTVEADTVITAEYKKREISDSDDEDGYRYELEVDYDDTFMPDTKDFSTQLYVYRYDNEGDNEGEVNASNFRINSNYFENENMQKVIENYFAISADGKLSAKQPVPMGDYEVPVAFEYGGETWGTLTEKELWETKYNAEIKNNTCYYGTLYVTVGASVSFRQSWYVRDNEKNNYRSVDRWGVLVKPGAKFGGLYGGPELRMYGGYTFTGWYEKNSSKKIEDDYSINSYLSLYSRFEKGGKAYNPVVKTTGDSSNVTPPINNGGSRSSGRSGGGNGILHGTLMFGTWEQLGTGWRFRQNSGQYAANQWGKINGAYYYFGADGTMATGWVMIHNSWYYFNPAPGSAQGMMQTGWVFDPILNGWFYLDSTGEMKTDWQQINGKWYYMNPISDGTRGIMAVNTQVGDYFVDGTGARIE